jgi:hypothetical protein
VNRLAKVAAPEELSSLEGAIARARVEVPQSWAGSLIEVDVPRRLSCGACDGGGCDRCQRSGAIKLDSVGALSVRLPEELGEGAVLRIPQPFEGDELAILLLEVRVAEAPSGCRRIGVTLPRLLRSSRGSTIPAILVLLAIAALVAAVRWAS